MALVGCREGSDSWLCVGTGDLFSGLSNSLTPFKGDCENESHSGFGRWGRLELNSVHTWLDYFGPEFLVLDSIKDSLRVLMSVWLFGAGSPSGLKQLCPESPPNFMTQAAA